MLKETIISLEDFPIVKDKNIISGMLFRIWTNNNQKIIFTITKNMILGKKYFIYNL